MAVTTAHLTGGTDTDGNSTASTASVTPTSNNLVFLTVSSRTGITADPNTPTATGNGLTWVLVKTVVFDTTGSSRRKVSVLRALGASPSAGAIAIDFGGQAQTDVLWEVDQFSGVDTTGTNGSGAVVQSVSAIDETGSVTTLTVTLAAFGSVNNATFGAFSDASSQTWTAGTGFAITAQTTTANNSIAAEFKNSNDTTVDASIPTGSQEGGIGIEIKAVTGTGNFFPFFRP
jgi:hypothetical protein